MIFVDGHSEKAIAESLKEFSDKVNRHFEGKVEVLCLANFETNKFSRKLSVLIKKANIHIFLIADVDCFNNDNRYNNFVTNLATIKNNKNISSVKLILQDNLEAELRSCFNISNSNLFELFGANSKDTFVSRIIKMNANILFKKINTLENKEFWSNKFYNLNPSKQKEIENIVGPLNSSVFK